MNGFKKDGRISMENNESLEITFSQKTLKRIFSGSMMLRKEKNGS